MEKDYKQLYLKRIKEKNDDEDNEKAKKQLEDIINRETVGVKKFGKIEYGECDCEFCQRIHGDYIYSGLLEYKPSSMDRIGHYAAFILNKETQIMGAGLEVLQDFGVIEKGKIYRYGFRTISDGRTFTKYNNPYYIGVAILEIDEKNHEVTIGLGSATDYLDIYKLNTKKEKFEKIMSRIKLE